MTKIHQPLSASTYGDDWAPHYDAEHRDMQASAAQLDLLESLADGRPVLELGVGTGRVALPLAERSLDVHGLDSSPAMLAKLEAKAAGASLTLHVGDMANTRLPVEFGAVYAVFNTFFWLTTQEEQLECFRTVASMLGEGGAFCLECFVPDPTRFGTGANWLVIDVDREHGVLAEASVHDPVGQRVDTQLVRMSTEGVRIMPVTIRYAWPAELDLMAKLAGLELRDRWGDWDRSSFTAASSSHISVYTA